jgi:Zn-dependent M28 family amino/carboxypeptidase
MRGIILRQIPRPRIFLPRLRRYQHGEPHKEYFQKPSQFPAAPVPQYTPPPQPTFPTQSSFLRRLTRSTFWAVSYGVLGVTAGTAAITYEYLQPLFEVGTEEELEELEGIKEIMSSHPLLDSLGQDENWKEQAMYMEDRDWDQEKDFHFLSRKTLKGANGVSMVC